MSEVSDLLEQDFFDENQLLKDQLDSIELMIVSLERSFSITINDKEEKKLHTVAEIVSLLKDKGGERFTGVTFEN